VFIRFGVCASPWANAAIKVADHRILVNEIQALMKYPAMYLGESELANVLTSWGRPQIRPADSAMANARSVPCRCP
jgi:hypothetical protein